jgi:hypothetical protein
MSRATLRFALLLVALALGTRFVGWWTVPVIGAAYGLLAGTDRWPGLSAAIAGALVWIGELVVASVAGAPIGAFGRDLAISMQLPSWAMFIVTAAFPALLSGSAAVLTAALRRRVVTSVRSLLGAPR